MACAQNCAQIKGCFFRASFFCLLLFSESAADQPPEEPPDDGKGSAAEGEFSGCHGCLLPQCELLLHFDALLYRIRHRALDVGGHGVAAHLLDGVVAQLHPQTVSEACLQHRVSAHDDGHGVALQDSIDTELHETQRVGGVGRRLAYSLHRDVARRCAAAEDERGHT